MRLFSAFAALICIFILTGFSTTEFPATSLRISVIDNLGNIVEGAKVAVYGTEEDYRNEENPVVEPVLTNAKGIVKFKNIPAEKFFIYVTKDDMNNIGNGVETDKLEEGKVNKVTIVIE
jgi:hypothetical protein